MLKFIRNDKRNPPADRLAIAEFAESIGPALTVTYFLTSRAIRIPNEIRWALTDRTLG